MKKLVSSSEAAQILGLSLQGVHYRIKKGQLESIKQEGKIFVYVDESLVKQDTKTTSAATPVQQTVVNSNEDVIKAKDEQIQFLKKTIKFVKKQYTSEIHRLENNQTKIFNVFQSEVDLLKSAFNEMKNIYQLEHSQKQTKQAEEKKEKVKEPLVKTESKPMIEFMSVQDFFIFMKQHGKTDTQIKQIILERVKNSDKRFIYKKENKDVIICKSDFLDLI